MFNKISLLLFILVLTATLQRWVGNVTIYSNEWGQMRLETHDIIVRNRPQSPESSLLELGCLACERRIAIPWLAEAIARITGNRETSLPAAYFYIDCIFLYFSFLLLWSYLRRWFDVPMSLLGLSYVAVTCITTYHEHFFHPWDRATFLLWLAMSMLVREKKAAAYLIVLALTLFTKFTAALFPLFFILVYIEDMSDLRRSRFWLLLFAQTGIVLACHFILNQVAFDSGIGVAKAYSTGTYDVLMENIHRFSTDNVAHPVFLMFSCPILLVAVGWRRFDHYMRSAVIFGFVFLAIHFAISLFVETRALTAGLIFFVPAALLSLRYLLENQQGNSAHRT